MNGFVLAGGRSTRMGTDKALLHYAGRPLIAHAVDLLRPRELNPTSWECDLILLLYAPVVEDLHPDCGPLGGIEAALASSSSDWNLFLPVDLPLSAVGIFSVSDRARPHYRRGCDDSDAGRSSRSRCALCIAVSLLAREFGSR